MDATAFTEVKPTGILPNGVKARADGAGDPWALDHRSLGRTFNMHDLDGLFGHIAFGQNTGERLFLEYAPDDYSNHAKVFRRFAIIAMFDRKSSRDWALNERNRLSTALYLWMCRTFGAIQPRNPKFFYVIGMDYPYAMVELNLDTAGFIGEYRLERDDWMSVWKATGLIEARLQLNRWILSR